MSWSGLSDFWKNTLQLQIRRSGVSTLEHLLLAWRCISAGTIFVPDFNNSDCVNLCKNDYICPSLLSYVQKLYVSRFIVLQELCVPLYCPIYKNNMCPSLLFYKNYVSLFIVLYTRTNVSLFIVLQELRVPLYYLVYMVYKN